MANKFNIEKGNRQLQDVEMITPDTKVNQKAVIKYPATDLNNGIAKESWTEDTTVYADGSVHEEEQSFDNPHEYVDPDSEEEEAGPSPGIDPTAPAS